MNMQGEGEIWNRRYAEGSHDAREPDPFLLDAYDEVLIQI